MLLDSTCKNQSVLANYCRTGNLYSLAGTNENIIQYRRLVYNVVDDMLQSAYPITYDLITQEEWDDAVNDFLANHPCQSPQIWNMPKEFHSYLTSVNHSLYNNYFFLNELMQFEWLEIELFMMEDIAVEANEKGDLLTDKLLINPEYELLYLTYPVHKKKAEAIKKNDKGNYYLIAHRHPDGNVIFTDLSPALVKIIELLLDEPAALNSLLDDFEKEFTIKLNDPDKHAIIQFITNAIDKKLIIGFKK